MNTMRQSALKDDNISIKIKLAALWSTIMCLYIYCDFFNLMTPGTIEGQMNLETPVGPVTPSLLVIFSSILIVPSMMIGLNVLLPARISRWLNIVVATLWSVISILILVSNLMNFDAWYVFYSLFQVIEIIVFTIIIYLAIKWPKH